MFKADTLKRMHNLFLDELLLRTGHLQNKSQIIKHIAVFQQTEVLKNNSQFSAQMRNLPLFNGARTVPCNQYFTPFRPYIHIERFKQCRLSTSALTDNIDQLPLLYNKVEILEDRFFIKLYVNVN